MPFYKNPRMLAEQYRIWTGYPDELKAQIEIVLVDDGSPAGQTALAVSRPAALPPLRIYRVLVDLPWHQHGARNLAAREAVGPWLFLTDMDHVLPTASLAALLHVLSDATPDKVFTFFRRDAVTLKPTRNERGELKPHVNTFAMTKGHFWTVGGYDEACVGYGTDSYFRARLRAAGPLTHLPDIAIVRYPREVIPDASGWQPGMDPRAFRNAGRRREETQQNLARKGHRAPMVLAFPWERIL
jgi:glycosyltransferase involved in cell wall biosynthesis